MPIYMKIEGIKGNVTATGYPGWIELESAQLGSTGASRSNISEIVVTKEIDDNSAELFRESLQGKGRKVTIAFCKTERAECIPYLKIDLTGAHISSYSVSGGGARPMESLSINFTKITYVRGSAPVLQHESWYATNGANGG